MNYETENTVSGNTFYSDPFPRLSSFRFDDFGVVGKLALVVESGAWAWVEPTFTCHVDDGLIRLELLAESGTEMTGIPCDVYAVIDLYFRFEIPFSMYNEVLRERAMTNAGAAFRRFLDGEHQPFSRLIPMSDINRPKTTDPRETEIIDVARVLIDKLGSEAQGYPVKYLHEDIEERVSFDTARWIIGEELRRTYGVVKKRCPERSMLVYEFPRCSIDGTPLPIV